MACLPTGIPCPSNHQSLSDSIGPSVRHPHNSGTQYTTARGGGGGGGGGGFTLVVFFFSIRYVLFCLFCLVVFLFGCFFFFYFCFFWGGGWGLNSDHGYVGLQQKVFNIPFSTDSANTVKAKGK